MIASFFVHFSCLKSELQSGIVSDFTEMKPVLILLLDDLEFSIFFPTKMINIVPACLFDLNNPYFKWE